MRRICSVDGCDRQANRRGCCEPHYRRLRKYGDLLSEKPVRQPGKALEFFQNTVLPYKGDDCLIWPFYTNRKGYARLRFNGKFATVSRLVCEHVHGPAPTDQHEAAHSCGKGSSGCVSPACVYWATPKENHADRIIHESMTPKRRRWRKLTEADVRKIREMFGKETNRAIAQKFGVSETHIDRIKAGKVWREA